MVPKQKSSLKTGKQRQASATLEKSVTVPIKLENQGREKATATHLLGCLPNFGIMRFIFQNQKSQKAEIATQECGFTENFKSLNLTSYSPY